jgi:iron complex transport system substrate-binding protein
MRGMLALFLLIFSACAERGHASPRAGQRAPRVVSLHDVTTELMVALGAVDRLVGVEEPVDVTNEVKSAIAKIPRVSAIESVLATKPDVVFGLDVVAEQAPETVRRLRQAGVEVELADPKTLDDVSALTRLVSRRVGATAAGEKWLERLRAAAQASQASSKQALRVFVYDCCDPPFTAGGQTVLTDLIARAGGRNVFADVEADWTHVSWEDVVTRQPELVVIHAYRHEGQADVPGKRRALGSIPSLGRLPVAVLPLGCSLGGLRSLEGLEKLRAAIRERS